MANEIKLPPLPENSPNVTRRIRLCEGEVAAQIVLEYALKEYATQAVEAYKAGLIEKWENYHANEAEGEAFAVGYFIRMEEEDAYKAQQQGEAMTDLQGRLVAISLAVADQDDRTAQSMLSETLRLLAASHNAGAQQPLFAEMIAQHPGLSEELRAIGGEPVQQPLTDDQIDALMIKECLPKNMRYAFSAGIRSAECAHNIGAKP